MATGGVSAPARQISEPPVGGRSLLPGFPQSSFNTGVLQEEILAMEGEYSVCYDTLSSIGKGAFGFVRLAQKKEDGLLVRIIHTCILIGPNALVHVYKQYSLQANSKARWEGKIWVEPLATSKLLHSSHSHIKEKWADMPCVW